MKKKKANEKKLNIFEIFNVIIFLIILFWIPFSYVGIVIANIVIDYNLLVGYLMRTICKIFISLPIFELFFRCLFEIKSKKLKIPKNKTKKNSFSDYVIVLFLGLVLFYDFLDLIDIVKDWSQGTKEIYLDNYEIKYRNRKGLSLDCYIVTYYDENGKEHELKTTQYMSLYDYEEKYKNSVLKIKYYENIGMFEEYEYIEKINGDEIDEG